MKPHVVADLNVTVVAARFGNQRLDSTGFMGNGFLDKNVGSGMQSGQCLLHVVHRRSADQHDIRPEFPERFAIVAEGFPLQFLTASGQRFGAGVAKAELLDAKGLEILCMSPANGTATDYQGPISYPVGNSGHGFILIAWSRAHTSARLSLQIR